jgi:hypothetical protein
MADCTGYAGKTAETTSVDPIAFAHLNVPSVNWALVPFPAEE